MSNKTMNINILRNTLAASAVLAMSTAVHAEEPNMGHNNHFEGVSLQAGVNFENTGKNEYVLDSKYDNTKSANFGLYRSSTTQDASTKSGDGNLTYKFEKLSYERDSKLQIGGELGVTYRQPMGEGLLVGGYVGVSYNFDNEHSYNFKAKGTGGAEESILEYVKSKLGEATDGFYSGFSGTLNHEGKVTSTGTSQFGQGTITVGTQTAALTAFKHAALAANQTGDYTATAPVALTVANDDADTYKTTLTGTRDINVKVKNDFSFIVAGTVGMPVMDRLLLEGMVGVKIDTYKFNATVEQSEVTASKVTGTRKFKPVNAKSLGTVQVKGRITVPASGANATENSGGNQTSANASTGTITHVKLDTEKIAKELNQDGTTTWGTTSDTLHANIKASSEKSEEKSKMCYKGYVGLRAIFNVKDNLDVGVKGYVAFPLKSEYELELSKKDGGAPLVTATFKPKMQFGGGLFVSYSF